MELFNHTNQTEKFEIYQKKLNDHILNKNFIEKKPSSQNSFLNGINLTKFTSKNTISNGCENENDLKDYKSSKIINKNFLKYKSKTINNNKDNKNLLKKNTLLRGFSINVNDDNGK